MEVLVCLAKHSGETVPKETLMAEVWGDTFVTDDVLTRSISELRKALADDAKSPQLIETIPRRGYRLRPNVQPALAEPRRYGSLLAIALGVVVVVGVAGLLLWPDRVFTEKDTVLLVDFDNQTGETIFDNALKQALRIQLAQSPFLNLLPEEDVRETLRFMGRPPGDHVSGDLAREICQRNGIKAMVGGSIASLGHNYVVSLDVRNCQNGKVLSSQQVEVKSKEEVLSGLGKAAASLRANLGEALSSIEKYDAPVEKATTSSLEALQAYSFARQNLDQGGDPWDAIPFLVKATEVDPNFAMAHVTLGEIYSSGGPSSNDELARRSFATAFALRDRVTQRERLHIESTYYEDAARDLGKAADAYELWKWGYPKDVTPFDALAGIYLSTGQYEKAAENARSALRLRPKRAISLETLAAIYRLLNRLDEAKALLDQSIALGFDTPRVHWQAYTIAYLRNDRAAMQKELDWARERGQTTRVPFHQALVSAAKGQLRQSEDEFRQTMDERLSNHDQAGAALASVQLAIIEAHLGYPVQARKRAASSLKLLSANTDLAALALAVAGDDVGAQKVLEGLLQTRPQDTLLTNVIAPVVKAQLELKRGQPKLAINLLRSAEEQELGADNAGRGFMAIYLRGQAYLQMLAGKEAAVEFQKIIDHPGVAPFSPLHALAYLGLARAYGLENDQPRSRAAYEEFFARWKDADPDLPILIQAKAERARLAQ